MKRIQLLAVATLALGLQGCNTFYADADQPLFCLGLPAQTFSVPGGGGVAPAGGFSGTYAGSIDVGLSNVLPDFIVGGPSRDRVLHFLSFDASVSGGPGTNMDFLSNLEVQALGPTGSTPVPLAHYDRGSQTGVTRISLDSDDPGANLSGFVANGGLSLQVSGAVSVPAGQVVPATWSAQVTSCFSANIHKTLQQMIDGG
jgi:hypothetical protein